MSHHATVHAVHTRFPYAGATVRLARRWVASHLLSGMFPIEAIALLIAKVFTDPASLETPGSVAAGFLRFLYLLSSHDFLNQLLIVHPQGHLTRADYDSIYDHFEACRGDGPANGPKALRKAIYKNLTTSAGESVLHEWRPVDCLMESLCSKFGDKAVFFFNELTPDLIAALWRPDTFKTQPLSALHSENK